MQMALRQAGSPADKRAWVAAHIEPLQALLDVTAPLVQQTQALERDQLLALFDQAHRLEWLCLDLASTADQFAAADWLPVIQVTIQGSSVDCPVSNVARRQFDAKAHVRVCRAAVCLLQLFACNTAYND